MRGRQFEPHPGNWTTPCFDASSRTTKRTGPATVDAGSSSVGQLSNNRQRKLIRAPLDLDHFVPCLHAELSGEIWIEEIHDQRGPWRSEDILPRKVGDNGRDLELRVSDALDYHGYVGYTDAAESICTVEAIVQDNSIPYRKA